MSRQPINAVQNTVTAQRLLGAQSRLYTDAKRIHDLRLALVFAAAVGTVIAALSIPAARVVIGGLGGVALLLLSVVGSDREKRRRREAGSVQEEFDTLVFDLPWNSLVAERPSPDIISEAAARYRGSRTRDWYPQTGNVIRPLDILICQRSNLGWGSSTHRLWAAILTAALVALVALSGMTWVIMNLTPTDALTALVFPLVGPARELVEMVKANRDSAETKRQAEGKVLSLWQRGMTSAAPAVTIEDCRSVQDKIVAIRHTNAYVPDWVDGLRRSRNESVMQGGASHQVEEAERNSRTHS